MNSLEIQKQLEVTYLLFECITIPVPFSWDQTGFKFVGRDNMRVLNCKSADMVEKEIVAGILAYSLVRATMAFAALRVGKDPRTLSFSNAVDVIHAHLPALQQAKTVPAAIDIAEQILDQIGHCTISYRKKKRLPQPRIKRSRTTPYRISNKPRQILVDAMFLKMAID